MKKKCGEIFWDDEGYGYVMFEPEFRRDEPIICLDAISDWILGMTNEYNDQVKRSLQTVENLRRNARRVTKKR